MDNLDQLAIARAIHKQRAREQRANTIFQLSWRGGGTSQITGYNTLAATLHISVASIPVLLSKGGGAAFTLMRPSPLTGELDLLTIARPIQPKAAPKRRGRPPKYPIDAQRLGGEFLDAPIQAGINLAPPARPVPKRTNRRTGEKP